MRNNVGENGFISVQNKRPQWLCMWTSALFSQCAHRWTCLVLLWQPKQPNTNTHRWLVWAAGILPRLSDFSCFPVTHTHTQTHTEVTLQWECLQLQSDGAVQMCTNLTLCSWHVHVRCSRLVSVIVHFSGLRARSAPSPVFCYSFLSHGLCHQWATDQKQPQQQWPYDLLCSQQKKRPFTYRSLH